ncbi:hypothetical protein BAUCODRAFT_119977 [Baudoinia panamericana UAMH 10762]|uniref:Uncharacterized protein n=1 Tax=Baudoinia panamericana (strain UAMH 10762) TaxID=717646 RepID=M2NH59_BAUPA|nr:uncharacterized protein BAUCODRAFT_119977 [Baudoinia panamericana UAMH 10762]EMC98669.1 hypothetical protein BAUCODRAFT_119977 [Baudoinia panamericana UAMH 10762]
MSLARCTSMLRGRLIPSTAASTKAGGARAEMQRSPCGPSASLKRSSKGSQASMNPSRPAFQPASTTQAPASS